MGTPSDKHYHLFSVWLGYSNWSLSAGGGCVLVAATAEPFAIEAALAHIKSDSRLRKPDLWQYRGTPLTDYGALPDAINKERPRLGWIVEAFESDEARLAVEHARVIRDEAKAGV